MTFLAQHFIENDLICKGYVFSDYFYLYLNSWLIEQVKRAPGPVPVNSIPIRKAPKTSATQKTASGAINQLRNFAGQ